MKSVELPLTVQLCGIRKSYGATKALDALDLELVGGQVLGVAGPNGAGKSTMVGVLAGETQPDSGQFEMAGVPWRPELGTTVAVVHQEPQVFANLLLGENLLVGRERFRVGRARIRDSERALLKDFQLLDVAAVPLGLLPLAVRQQTEIMRALLLNAQIFLFDEPNSALSSEESAALFEQVHKLADVGKVVVLVSHRLGELAQHCDRVVVIRDGRVAADLVGASLSADRIGRELVVGSAAARAGSVQRRSAMPDSVLLHVRDWTHRAGTFREANATFHGGEVTAVMGVEGSGGREFVRSLAQLEPTSGHLEAAGAVTFAAGDRRNSLFANLSVEENLAVRTGRRFAGVGGWWMQRAVTRSAEQARVDFGIKVGEVSQPIGSLSGGNQQKVVIASAILSDPMALALEEPTRGVDVGAKGEIYAHLRRFADTGRSVVMYCSEELEAFSCADRVLLMLRGRIVDEILVANFENPEDFAAYLAGGMSDGGQPAG